MRSKVYMKFIGILGLATLLAATPLTAFSSPGSLSPGPDSPVADAAMRGEIATVRVLLRAGADVNAPQGDGMTALHWAAERGDAAMTEMLLYAGANFQSVTRIGDYTPLHLASKSGQASTVKTLLEAGSDPNIPTTTGGAIALHFASASGSTATIEALLDHGSDVNVREPVHGQTPLIFATSSNRLNAVNTLIARGADVALQTVVVDTATRSARDRVIRQRRNDILAAFRAEKEDPSTAFTPTEVQTAMLLARQDVKAENAEPEEEEEPDPDEFRFGQTGGYGGLTALLYACREGHRDVAIALLDAGADLEQTGTGETFNPLMMSIVNGHFDLAMLLVQRGANTSFASDSGDTPLYAVLDAHWAPKATGRPRQRAYEQQEAGYLELMEAILKTGVDPNVRLKNPPPYESRAYLSVNVSGATAFWRAAYATDVDGMRLLLEYGADHSIPTLNNGRGRRFGGSRSRNRNRGRSGAPQTAQGASNQQQQSGRGGNPYQQIAARGRGGNEASAQARVDPSGLPAVPIGGPGVYPMQAASGVGYGQGFAGNSHRHVPDGWLPAITFLVDELGHEVNSRDLNGYTALHHAAARGHNEMVIFLMERGADASVISRRGQTTADMANKPSSRLPHFPETMALMMKLGSKLTPKGRLR